MRLLAVTEALQTHCYHYNEWSSVRRELRDLQYNHTDAQGGGGCSSVVGFLQRLVSVQLLHAVTSTHSLYLEQYHLQDKQFEF